MKVFQITLAAIIALLGLAGASCSGPLTDAGTTISQAVITTGVKYTNQPENNLEQVGDSSSVIYLAAEVNHPTSTTEVRVVWQKLPNQIIATETFTGKRTNTRNQLDFDYRAATSWLSSRIERPNLSWPMGDYKTEVYLDNNLAKTVFFSIVSDTEAEKQRVQGLVSSLTFGDTLTDDNQLASTKTTFSRTTPIIYIQVKLADAPAGTDLQVAVRQVKTDLIVNTFSSVGVGDDTLLFSLDRNQFGRLWSDKLWPVGSFEVTAKISQATARVTNFVIQS